MNKATTAAHQLPPGTVIDGNYTTGALVRTRLGAATYAATDSSGARVQVTVYAPECFVSPVALERSLRELRQLAKIHAPQVLQVLDAGKLPQGGIYEVHEDVDGPSLAEADAIPAAEVAPLIHEIVAGLQAAQKVGVLHRNLGTEAVLRTDRGVKLSGFAVGDPLGGVSFGALDCIAPEQVEGRNIDERTLVYNLAALTYRMLRGASLFTGGDNGTQLLQAAGSLPEQESMPAPLYAALAKDPKSRPNLLQRFLGDLDAIIREFPRKEPVDVRLARDSTPSVTGDPARDAYLMAMSARGGERGEVGDTLDMLMTDPDAPKLPSSDAKAGAAAGSSAGPATPEFRPESRPGTLPPRPAIITGPGMLGTPPAAVSKPSTPMPAAPPSLGGLPNAPSLGSLGKPAPSLAPPPGLPPIGKPGGLGAPGLGAPNLGAPNLGAPGLGAPNLGVPSVSPPGVSPPGVSPPDLSPPGLVPPSFGAPSVAAPSAAAPASTSASASASAAAKPRTRGWTMFMEVTEDEAGGPAAPGVPLPGGPVTGAPAGSGMPVTSPAPATPAPAPLPVAAAPAPAPGPAAAPAATGEVKPSTRGWTMIMDDPAEADPSAAGLSTPAAAPPPPSPTTRGWTMLEELNDSLPVAPAPVGSATPAAATPAPAELPAASGAPSSRGWTMFMEAELQGTPKPDAEPEAEPEFYDGQVKTDSGTVVTFAPTAPEPIAAFRAPVDAPAPDLDSQEPMKSFGARLRGDAEPAASLAPPSPPSPPAEIPSFAGNNLGIVPVAKPDEKLPAERPQAQPATVDSTDIEVASGGNTKLIVVGVLVVVIVVAIILATT